MGSFRRITWQDIIFYLFQTGQATPVNKPITVPLAPGEVREEVLPVKRGLVLVVSHWRSWCDPDSSVYVKIQVDGRLGHEYIESFRDYWIDMFEAGLPVIAEEEVRLVLQNVTSEPATWYAHVLGALVRKDVWEVIKSKVMVEVEEWLTSTP